MTPEQITRSVYVWLMHASRIDNLPMGTRPCSWDELVSRDPDLAARWRRGVDLFLEALGAEADADEHLNFTGSLLPPLPEPVLVPDDDDDPDADRPSVRPDD